MSTPTLEVGSPVVTAEAARATQLAIRGQLLRDVAKLWLVLDARRLSATFPGWLRAMQLLVRSYHGQSSVAAGAFYRSARAHATQSPAPRSMIHYAPAPADEWLAKAFGYSGPALLSKDTARPGTALSTTLGTAARIAQDGGRATILNTAAADPVAVGWYRLTDGNPCSFCAVLASRGIAYKAEQSAAFESHNHCGCTAAPAFTRDHALPDLSAQARRVYREATRNSAPGQQLNDFRKAWETRSR